MTLTSYKEKMKELPLLSLFCSCLGREPQEKPREAEASADVVDLNWCVIRDMEVVEMNKRASGQAFEVILKPPSFDGGPETSISSPDYKNPSQEEVKDKPDVAEERRKCKEAELHSNRAEEGERKNEVTQRPVEENFVKVSRVEHEKNVEHLQEKEKHAEEVRTIEETQEDAVKHYFQIKCEDSVNLKTFKGSMRPSWSEYEDFRANSTKGLTL